MSIKGHVLTLPIGTQNLGGLELNPSNRPLGHGQTIWIK